MANSIRKNHMFFVLLLISLSSRVQSEVVDIAGKITDNTGKAVSGATVTVKKIPNLATTTKSDGTFRLQQNTSIHAKKDIIDLESDIYINENIVIIKQNAAQPIRIVIHDLKGKLLYSIHKEYLEKGSHLFTIPENLAASVYLFSITRGSVTRHIKVGTNQIYTSHFFQSANDDNVDRANIAAVAVDTIIITKDGFVEKKQPIDSYIDSNFTSQLSPVTINYPKISGSCRPCGQLQNCLRSCPNNAIVNKNGKAVLDKSKCRGVDSGCNAKCTRVTCFLKVPSFLKNIYLYFSK